MTETLMSVAVVVTSLLALWLSARHWWGWALGAFSEVLWAIYSVELHSLPLLLMSFVYFAVYVRNALETRKLSNAYRR